MTFPQDWQDDPNARLDLSVLGRPQPAHPPGHGMTRTMVGAVGVAVLAVIGSSLFWVTRDPASPRIAPVGEAVPGIKQPSPAAELTSPPMTPSSTPPATTPVATVTDLRPVSESLARRLLAEADAPISGKVRVAVQWRDGNGRNLLVATRRVDARDGDRATAATIRVQHLTGTDTAPRLVRTMTDPSGTPCEFDFSMDVDPAEPLVKDLDGDGVAEVAVAWYRSCRSDVGTAVVKVALLSNGRKYIVRGEGWPGERPPVSSGLPPGKVTQVEPVAGQWPEGFREAASEVFLRAYG